MSQPVAITDRNDASSQIKQSWGRAGRNYPVNCWWVAAGADEVAEKPLSRWLLDQRVVLYRRRDGSVAALEDRCPHRWAPLSQGRLADDVLTCRYHGFQFDAGGVCVHVPTQGHIPGSLSVRTYPIAERGGYVWIWMGEPANADHALLPDVAWFERPSNLRFSGSMEVACNYMLIQENVLDLTHFGHLHADTLAQTGWENPSMDVRVERNTVTYEQRFNDVALAPFQALPMQLEIGKHVDRVDWGTFLSPAAHVAGIDVTDPRPGADGRTSYAFRIMHLTTPIAPDRTHYWWAVSQDYGQHDPEVASATRNIIEVTFDQDKDVLESIQDTVNRSYQGGQANEVSVTSDQPGLQARRILQAMLARES